MSCIVRRVVVVALLLCLSAGSSITMSNEPVRPEVQTSNAFSLSKFHPSLLQLTDNNPEMVKAWVFFQDKGEIDEYGLQQKVARLASTYNKRAATRRQLRGQNWKRKGRLFDYNDLPVFQDYIDQVSATGASIHVTSKWVNAVSVLATRSQLEEIAQLAAVQKMQPVARTAKVIPDPIEQTSLQSPGFDSDPSPSKSIQYGNSQAQLEQMNLIALHQAGYTGAGVVIGILDSGFQRTHEAFNEAGHTLNVIAEWDFINNDGNTGIETGDPSSQHDHGTKTLSCIGAYKPNSLVGGAFDASFILCKTEDTSGEYEAEEDNYVAGLEFIEANGGDMATASLGYIDWYTQADLDGLTAVTTIAVNIATANGLHCCNSAGNEYHDTNPATSSLIAPADALQVISCGAVDSGGTIAYFSSDGPTADGRVKPELLARGVSAHVVSSSSNTTYTTADGTSFSAPLIAGAVACLIQARPNWTVDQMREHLFQTASDYVANGTHDPQFVRGYGIIDAFAAYSFCPDAGTVQLDSPAYGTTDTVNIVVADCGLNLNDTAIEQVTVDIDSDSEAGVEQVVLTETASSSAEFAGSILLRDINSQGVLLVANGDTITVTYIDADDGQGSTNVVVTATAAVDTQAPIISNVRAEDLTARSASITYQCDEEVKGTVHYGTSCGLLNESSASIGFSSSVLINLTGLEPEQTYFYTVEAEDPAGNSSSDDNGGMCYSFTTESIPDFFTELFDTDNDLDYKQLTFTPNGTYDYYRGCTIHDITELPVDPATGTVISLTDDSFGTVTLTGGKQISFYGETYNTFYPVSNGYLTFVQGVTDYSETLAEHFGGTPKICALYDDLDPEDGGAVRWEQLSDRVVVTWDGVPEHNESIPNTAQIEMFFDGMIRITYLSIDATDGIAGLSRGEGLDPSFVETDLSAMSGCDPIPPQAFDDNVSTAANHPVSIVLTAYDDGLPDPPAALDYIITALPYNGSLHDPNGGAITAAPYTLLSEGNVVDYIPDTNYYGSDSLDYKANDGGTFPQGGDSEEATVTISVIANPPVTQNVSHNLDINTSANITLDGSDPDSDPLEYVIITLPNHGELYDPNGGEITSLPYTLVDNGQIATYIPQVDYAGDDSFIYQASDAIFDSNLSTVSLTIIAEEPQIATTELPAGSAGTAYGPVQLEVSGGQPTVTWSLVTDLDYVEQDLGESQFSETGTGLNWHQDEGFWLYDMPFSFPFYGDNYDSIRIRPNGFINMGSFTGSASSNSDTGLIANKIIAPMWDDLDTLDTGEDVFIDETVTGQVTIRWQASTIAPDNSAVDFSVVLSENGEIRFDYGITNTSVTPTIGVSNGDGTHYTLASINGNGVLTGQNSLLFRIPVGLPEGMEFDSTGLLNGIPLEAGDFEPVFKVRDSLGREDQKLLNLHIAEFVQGNFDYDDNGIIDLADYAGFQLCFTGSEQGPPPANCEMFHTDADGDIDLVDFAGFISAMEN